MHTNSNVTRGQNTAAPTSVMKAAMKPKKLTNANTHTYTYTYTRSRPSWRALARWFVCMCVTFQVHVQKLKPLQAHVSVSPSSCRHASDSQTWKSGEDKHPRQHTRRRRSKERKWGTHSRKKMPRWSLWEEEEGGGGTLKGGKRGASRSGTVRGTHTHTRTRAQGGRPPSQRRKRKKN